MATPPREIAAEVADRFGINEDDAWLLLCFGDHRSVDGDEPPLRDDPTMDEIQAWQEQTKAAHDAMHWTRVGITRNVKSVLSRRGDVALKANEAKRLRTFLENIQVWENSGVLQRVADFVAGVRVSGAGEILSHAPKAVVANLLTALDPTLLAKETLERLQEDIDDYHLPTPSRLQDAFNELESEDLNAIMQESPLVLRTPTNTRH